jgi:hypothetical protein
MPGVDATVFPVVTLVEAGDSVRARPGRLNDLGVSPSKSVLCGRAGRLTVKNGGFRPGQVSISMPVVSLPRLTTVPGCSLSRTRVEPFDSSFERHLGPYTPRNLDGRWPTESDNEDMQVEFGRTVVSEIEAPNMLVHLV